MVSVVCSNALSKTLLEERITDTAAILDRTRTLVMERFQTASNEVRDGMDIALCAIKRTGDDITLKYSGANRPLWIRRGNEDSIEEHKPDKQPIGEYINSKPFSSTELKLHAGDQLFLFSDGFPDQFGGQQGKKLKTGAFKRLINNTSKEKQHLQKDYLSNQLEHWMGQFEQVDDICVIGISL